MTTLSSMLRRTPTLDADKEAFEKVQTISIQKAINAVECAAKEKHVRNAILGTYQDKGAQMFWHVVRRLPLSTQSIIAWKFCHVLHKVLRDGHANVLRDSLKYRQQLKDLGKNWSHMQRGYGRLIGSYLSCLTQRMEFHKKYEEFPGNLSIADETLEKIGHNDINAYFELCVDILDCLDCLMDLQQKVFSTLDMSRAISLTGPGQCRLAPLIPVILDSSQLYDYAVKLLFKLHASLPADTLSGHRQRFQENYKRLKKFYNVCSNLQYFKRLIQVPQMPDTPPDFLLNSDGSHELGPVRVMQEEDAPDHDRSPSPEPEPTVGQLVDTNFDEMFGGMEESFPFNGVTNQPDPRDEEIERLRAEIAKLKAEIEMMQTEHSDEVRRLLQEIDELKRDIEANQIIAHDLNDENIKLKKDSERLQAQADAAAKVQSLLPDIEKRAHGSEEMYKKLKEKHLALVKDHADLLRKNADNKKVAESLHQSAGESENERNKLRDENADLRRQLELAKSSANKKDRLRDEEQQRLLVAAVDEARDMVRFALASLDEENQSRTCSAQSLILVVEQTAACLDNLNQQSSQYKETKEISGLIQTISSFGHWVAETIENGGATCNMAPDNQGDPLSPTKRSCYVSDLVMGLETACRGCGEDSFALLDQLKEERGSTSCDGVKRRLEEILNNAKDLLPKISDERGSDLHDLVEQEMASTTQAVEQAAERIEALLNEARQRDSGVNLEVNERILDSCTELMKCIRVLIATSKELQREIVAQGRGASSSKEFYMKNSRWTEGLISAAKAVGWGATMLTDSADLVVQGNGKFEELMVWSHEISASTAQLVAASRVKASKESEKLGRLQSASRNVNGATARVVASTNAGRRQLDDASESMADIAATVTQTQVKRKEMDSQVRVLELEQSLQQERIRLGTLRKKRYELDGVKDEEENEADSPQEEVQVASNASAPVKPAVPQKPVVPPKPVEQ
ncbi:huntingtin-interacting protein 1-like isoform X2 [Clavelina lepadiformis]|uniref:huntingtin-interacting protein 1-like isoform X2 n=1 Tax=Clavelina lepadiformis TaxID=159417 RepID=UPI004041C8D4